MNPNHDPVVLYDPISGPVTDSQLRAICEQAQAGCRLSELSIAHQKVVVGNIYSLNILARKMANMTGVSEPEILAKLSEIAEATMKQTTAADIQRIIADIENTIDQLTA